MKKDYCDITVVLDRSGSMVSVKSDTIGGFNEFLKGQKAVPGEATITLTQFDTEYDIVYAGKNIQDTPDLTEETYVPRGMTALLDAIGKTINSVGERLGNMKEEDRPEKVIFVILTDGMENSSKEFKQEAINEMIKKQTDEYKWQFVYLGANQDAIAVGGSMGIPVGNTMTYAANDIGTKMSYEAISKNATSYRTGTSINMAFTEDDKDEQDKAGV